jgi:cytochrome c peroxidase
MPAPSPRAGVDFDAAAARRGIELFHQKADCNRCHRAPLWTEAGWNAHTPEDLKIDSFQADRSPDKTYKTMSLSGLFIRESGLFMKEENKGRYYHDGRFQTLLDVVNSYNTRFTLGLAENEKLDLVEYLKSL